MIRIKRKKKAIDLSIAFFLSKNLGLIIAKF